MKPARVVAACGAMIVLGSCASPATPQAPAPQSIATVTVAATTVSSATVLESPVRVSTASPAPPTSTIVVTETAQAGTAEAAGKAPAIMPDVVCQNLQDAQDEIQRAGVFFSRSDDASGQGRAQLIDRNWIVVAQTPARGSPVSEAEAILSAVKIGEPNNC